MKSPDSNKKTEEKKSVADSISDLQSETQETSFSNLRSDAMMQLKLQQLAKNNTSSVLNSHETGCGCGNCSGLSPVQMKSNFVIQRVRFLSDSQASALENHIQDALSGIEEDGDSSDAIYTSLNNIYNTFSSGSNAHAALSDIILLTSGSSNTRAQTLNNIVSGMLQQNSQNVRSANYPSNYNSTASNARDTYRTNHSVSTTQWRCPGNGSTNAHNAANGDITIDHITPCASHWNSTGYNTDRSTRTAWYNNTSNHHYMCRSCNSSLGSGGVTYRLDTGSSYSN